MTKAFAVTDVTVLETVDSTNDAVKRKVVDANEAAFVIAARRQTHGRGRSGRGWSSLTGNLAMTMHLPFEGSYQEAARLSFAVSLAVKDTLKALAPDAFVSIKWPNDVLLNNRKVCGILLENLGKSPNNLMRLLIGIGINLSTHPDPGESNWPPTSIKAETGVAPDFEATLTSLIESVTKRIEADVNSGFAETRQDWRASAARLGEMISVRLPNDEMRGIFKDIDATGALVLETPSGIRKITAGDVFFPKDATCS